MRLLHTMLRVGDLQKSIDFYTRVMGMKLLRTTDRPDQKYSLAFLGYESNPDQAELELTYNYGTTQYEMGTAYGHIAIGVEDAAATCATVKAAGREKSRERKMCIAAVICIRRSKLFWREGKTRVKRSFLSWSQEEGS